MAPRAELLRGERRALPLARVVHWLLARGRTPEATGRARRLHLLLKICLAGLGVRRRCIGEGVLHLPGWLLPVLHIACAQLGLRLALEG